MIYWDPSPALFEWEVPGLGRPILWYGLLFGLGCFLGYLVLVYLLKGYLRHFPELFPLKEIRTLARGCAERISFYGVVGMLVGARLGDLLFYQDWAQIQKDPLSALRFWEGGLASHGGAVGVVLALLLFSRTQKKYGKIFSFLRVLDLVVIPAALIGVFIRVGNFVNQEILGTPASVPWAVLFGHPADLGPRVPRHPVQLYEALFYLVTFAALLLFWKKKRKQKAGRMTGLFFLLIFGFRLIIERWKVEQSAHLTDASLLQMGQYLSIPFILAGVYLLFRRAH